MSRPAHAVWSEEAGPHDAPLLVLVHGAMDRSAGMLRLSRRLDDDFRVLRYDRRGYGKSLGHDGPFDMAHQVADLVDLLEARPAVLIGHSYGGNVALATAARVPSLVPGVVVYEPPLPWLPFWPRDTAGGGVTSGDGVPEAAAEAFMRRMIGDERWAALPDRTRLTRRAEGRALVGELGDLRRNAPWQVAEVAVPVVVGRGEHAGRHHVDGTRRLAEMLPTSTLVIVPGAGHAAPSSHPDEFRRLLVDPLLARLGEPWR